MMAPSPVGHAGHLAHHDHHPGEAEAKSQAGEDARQRCRQHHLGKDRRAGGAEHAGRLEQALVDASHAEHGVDEDRIERAEEDEKEGAARADAEQDHGQRQPRGHRHRAQDLQRRLQHDAHERDATDQQAERDGQAGRQQKAAVHARHRGQHVSQQRGAEGVVVDAADSKVPQRGPHFGGRRNQAGGLVAGREPPQQEHGGRHRRGPHRARGRRQERRRRRAGAGPVAAHALASSSENCVSKKVAKSGSCLICFNASM